MPSIRRKRVESHLLAEPALVLESRLLLSAEKFAVKSQSVSAVLDAPGIPFNVDTPAKATISGKLAVGASVKITLNLPAIGVTPGMKVSLTYQVKSVVGSGNDRTLTLSPPTKAVTVKLDNGFRLVNVGLLAKPGQDLVIHYNTVTKAFSTVATFVIPPIPDTTNTNTEGTVTVATV